MRGDKSYKRLLDRLKGNREKFQIVDWYQWLYSSETTVRHHWWYIQKYRSVRDYEGLYEVHVLFTNSNRRTSIERHWMLVGHGDFASQNYRVIRFNTGQEIQLGPIVPVNEQDGSEFARQCLSTVGSNFDTWLIRQLKQAVKVLAAAQTAGQESPIDQLRDYLTEISEVTSYFPFDLFYQKEERLKAEMIK
jgi:hypothetical protein